MREVLIASIKNSEGKVLNNFFVPKKSDSAISHDCKKTPLGAIIEMDITSKKWGMVIIDEDTAFIEINYCPFCGEKLNE